MKAQITEKIYSRTIQFAWDTQVLYLQIKKYNNNGNTTYSISDLPEEEKNQQLSLKNNFNNSFSIPVPLGQLNTNFNSKELSFQLDANKNIINNNIQFLKYIQEILDYIS